MKAAIISMGSVSSTWTAAAMRKYFDQVDDLSVRKVSVVLSSDKTRVLYDGEDLQKYDCLLLKGSYKYSILLRSVAEAKCDEAYIPCKPSAFTMGHNKLLTHLKLQKAGIPMPQTFVTASIAASKKVLEEMKYPVVMKFPSGTQGKGVMFADSYASASSLLDALTALKQPLIIQEYIETEGSDIRAFVVGNQVVGAYHRKAIQGEKRANIHAGGSGEPFEIDKKIRKVAIDAAVCVGAEICGVDILEGHKGPLVIEVNLSPGLQGITKVTGIDVAGKIAAFLSEKTKERIQKKEPESPTTILDNLKKFEKKESKTINSFIDHVKIKADKIVLPSFVTKICDFDENQEVEITAEKGKLRVTNLQK